MRAIVLTFVGLLALATASNGKKVVCYLGSWGVYRENKGEFQIDMIDPNLCTHLIYSFVGLGGDGRIKIIDPNADLPNGYGKNGYEKFNKLREINPNVKTMIAMGGWREGEANSKYSQVMASPSLRSTLVKSIVEFVEKYDFDGFDLDWEYPGPRRHGGRPQDKDNLVLFLKELKEAFEPRGLILSAAVAAGIATAETAYNIAEISKYLDFINLMEYDFHNFEEYKTGHNAPLYASSGDSDKTLNVDASIQYWLQQGAPAEKLVMGVPFYAKGFALANPSNNGVNVPSVGASRPGPYTKENGMMGYNEICENMNQWQVVFDKERRVPYAYSGNQWISFDDERSIAEKGEYVNKYGLGGMMVWSLETDDFRGTCGEKWPLLKAIKYAMGSSSISGSTVAKPRPVKSKVAQMKPTTRSYVNPPQARSTAAPRYPNYPSIQANQVAVACEGPGFLHDPSDCGSYHQCVFDGFKYNPVKMPCPPGLAWDTDSNTCNYKDRVQC